MITPIRTARAKLCSTAVTMVTTSMINTSLVGIRRNVRNDAHSNVPMATMIMSPVSAAIGSCSISGAPKRIKTKSITAATIPDKRARAPDETLIRDWPIMAHPPMPLKSPLRILALPCATHSRLPCPRVCVISSMMFNVSKLSSKPTPATMAAYGKMRVNVAQVNGTLGM